MGSMVVGGEFAEFAANWQENDKNITKLRQQYEREVKELQLKCERARRDGAEMVCDTEVSFAVSKLAPCREPGLRC